MKFWPMNNMNMLDKILEELLKKQVTSFIEENKLKIYMEHENKKSLKYGRYPSSQLHIIPMATDGITSYSSLEK